MWNGGFTIFQSEGLMSVNSLPDNPSVSTRCGDAFTLTFYGSGISDGVCLWKLQSKAPLFIDVRGNTHNRAPTCSPEPLRWRLYLKYIHGYGWFFTHLLWRMPLASFSLKVNYPPGIIKPTQRRRLVDWMRSLYLSILAVFPPSEPCPSPIIYFLAWVMVAAWAPFPGF